MEKRNTLLIVVAMSTIFALAMTFNSLQKKRRCRYNENYKLSKLQRDNFIVYDNNGAGDCLFYC
jgi:hypothetical protein